MPGLEGPTLRRRRLGAELKRCRERALLTQEQVSQHFEWHAAKVTRIETARVSVTPRDVKDMLSLYGVHDPAYRERLLELARKSRERAWWAEYRDIVQPDSFISIEADASGLYSWEPVLVPGLLQTEAYMRALFRSNRPPRSPERIDRAVSVRLARQSRLTGPDPLQLTALLDESVIRRPIGGPDVMAAQLRQVLDRSELPNVSVRLLPYEAGEHPLLGTSMAILEFHEAPELDVVYVEGYSRTSRFLKQPEEVAHRREVFERVADKCLDHDATAKLIESALTP